MGQRYVLRAIQAKGRCIALIADVMAGDEYEGTWRDSKAEGRGVYVWKNGDRYDGEWKENRKWGRGKKTFVATMDEYNGEWKVRAYTHAHF